MARSSGRGGGSKGRGAGAKWVARCGAGLLAIVCSGCLGGQTGQPGSASCDQGTVPAMQPVDGTSPAAFAETYTGRYTAPVRWLVTADGGAPSDDAITIDVTYSGADGATSCGHLYSVEVTAEITTRDSGVDERGTATLFQGGNGAGFRFSGKRIDVSATLSRSGDALTLSGTLTAVSTGLPSGRAEFPWMSGTAGSGGGASGSGGAAASDRALGGGGASGSGGVTGSGAAGGAP